MTSLPRDLRCLSPCDRLRIVEQIEMSTTRLRLTSASANCCSGRGTSDRRPGSSCSRPMSRLCRCPRRARRQPQPDRVVERHQTSCVPLAVHQKRQRACEHRAVGELAHWRRTAVGHRCADVEQQVAFDVGLLLELLHVVPIAARVDFPVERGQIVAWEVLAVLGELDAEAFVGLRCSPDEVLRRRSAPSSSIVPSRAITAGSRNRSSRAPGLVGIGLQPALRQARPRAGARLSCPA